MKLGFTFSLLLLGLLAGPAWAEKTCYWDRSSSLAWYICREYDPQTNETTERKSSIYTPTGPGILRYWEKVNIQWQSPNSRDRSSKNIDKTWEIDCQQGVASILSINYTGDWHLTFEEIRAAEEKALRYKQYFPPDSMLQSFCDVYYQNLREAMAAPGQTSESAPAAPAPQESTKKPPAPPAKKPVARRK